MSASDMVRAALISAGKMQKELAEYMGWTPQNLSSRLKNNTLTFDEMAKALRFAGYGVKLVDGNGDELPKLDNSSSPRVCQMISGKTYDTSKAESLCSSKTQHSDELYIELFKDAAGEYFMAYYQLWESGHNSISVVNPKAARMFWEQYSGKSANDFR